MVFLSSHSLASRAATCFLRRSCSAKKALRVLSSATLGGSMVVRGIERSCLRVTMAPTVESHVGRN